MKKSLLNKENINPACGLCANGRISPDGDSVLCVKTGIRKLDSSCNSFKYDPLKRKPKRVSAGIGEFKESDFKL